MLKTWPACKFQGVRWGWQTPKPHGLGSSSPGRSFPCLRSTMNVYLFASWPTIDPKACLQSWNFNHNHPFKFQRSHAHTHTSLRIVWNLKNHNDESQQQSTHTLSTMENALRVDVPDNSISYQSCTCMPWSHSENGSHPPRILGVQDSKLRPNPIHWFTQLLTNPKQGTSKWKTYTTQGVHGVRGNVYGSKIHQSTLRFAIEYPRSYASHCQSTVTGIIIPHIFSYIFYINYHWNHELDC